MNWAVWLTIAAAAATLAGAPWLYREMRRLISRRILMLDAEEILRQEDER